MARLGINLPVIERVLNHVSFVRRDRRRVSAPRLRGREAGGA
jgi:hypothetical protein